MSTTDGDNNVRRRRRWTTTSTWSARAELAYIVLHSSAWWLVSTRSDKLRRGSRAEIDRRALHNARTRRSERGGEKEGERRGERRARAVERGARPFPRVCIADKSSSALKGEEALERYSESSQHTLGFVTPLVKCAIGQPPARAFRDTHRAGETFRLSCVHDPLSARTAIVTTGIFAARNKKVQRSARAISRILTEHPSRVSDGARSKLLASRR